MGTTTNAEILELFGEEPKILASFGKDTESYQEGLLELYKKIRRTSCSDNAESLITSMFFDARRYDLAKVPAVINLIKKLALKNRIRSGRSRMVSAITGEVLVEEGQTITRELAEAIQNGCFRLYG